MTCQGISYDRVAKENIDCPKKVKEKEYCPAHLHQQSYTQKQLDNMKSCFCCKILFYSDERGECDKCYNRRKNKIVKCWGLTAPRGKNDSHFRPCPRVVEKNTYFCKLHQYMSNYTDEMIQNLTRCRRCSKMFYIEGDDDRCDTCKGGINLDKPRCSGKMVTRTNKQIENCKDIVENEGEFCKNHKYQKKYTEEEIMKLKICNGCNKLFPLVNMNQCKDCKIRLSKMNNVYNKESESDSDIEINDIVNHKCRSFKINETTGKIVSYKCKRNKIANTNYCLKHQYQLDLENLSSEEIKNCNKCTRIYRLDKYKSCPKCELNVKIVQYKQKSIRHQIGFCRIISFRSNKQCKNLIVIGNMCEFHFNKYGNIEDIQNIQNSYDNDTINYLEKYRKYLTNAQNSSTVVLKRYKKGAFYRKINWELTDNEALELFDKACFYCGIKYENKPIGIDRKNSKLYYSKSNCVSCCNICNMMKISLDIDVFINMCYHISVYNNFIEGNLKHWLFPDNKKSYYYQEFITNSNRRGLKIELTEDEYKYIIAQDCYICGKSAGKNRNFIDRLDSKQTYTVNNSKPCCKTCNIMKSTYSYEKFMNHILTISKRFYKFINLFSYDLKNQNNHIIALKC